MGQTAECEVEIDGKKDRGQALLESAELVFRGKNRLRIRLQAMKKVAVRDGVLSIDWQEGEKGEAVKGAIQLALGKKAALWADKIKNPPSRLDKLGVKPGMKIAVWGALAEDALAELRARADVHVGKPRGGEAIVFLAVESAAELARLADAAAKIARDGAVWVVRRKGPDAVVTEAASMAAGKAAGLVDTKVAAFSPTHTAERYVIPIRAR